MDPTGSGDLRWFDGLTWTAYTAKAVPGVVPPPPPGFETGVRAPVPGYRAPQRPTLPAVPAAQPTAGFTPAAVVRPASPSPDAASAVLDPRLGSKPPRKPSQLGARVKRVLKPNRPDTFAWTTRIGWLMLLGSCATLSYVVWQNTVTNKQAAEAQAHVEDEFEAIRDATADNPQVHSAFVFPAAEAAPDGGPAVKVPPPAEMPSYGHPAARIVIPSIEVDWVTSVGTGVDVLKLGPGVWQTGSMPGSPGNATIVGHRTTYGSPFRRLDQLAPGDQILIEVPGRPQAVYEVRGTQLVPPSATGVTLQTDGARLTLVTCDPPGSTKRRLVVQAEMVSGEYDALAVPADDWAFQL